MTNNKPSTDCPTILGDLASQHGVPKDRLLAMAFSTDPFNAGTPTDLAAAKWFAKIYETYGFGKGVHNRRIHYRLVSLPKKIRMPRFGVYVNTERCWKKFEIASKKARELGLVDAREFDDKRNPPPIIYAAELVQPGEPSWDVDQFMGFTLPRMHANFSMESWGTPEINISGYEYDSGQQPYFLEVWIEKGTVEEIRPICAQYGANLIPGIGTQSITSAVKMLTRAKEWVEDGRPVRILYISDFDPSGKSMPVAVARQIQFWMHTYGIEANVKLTPLALTKAQVIKYQLPRKPIKDSDRGKDKFEGRYGEGAVELDALEALHPGLLGEMLAEKLRAYRDDAFEERVADAEYEAQHNAVKAWQDATGQHENKIGPLRNKVKAVATKYEPKFKKLRGQVEKELAAIRKEAAVLEEELRGDYQEAADDLMFAMPDFPQPEIDPPDEHDWLFDSARPFLEQTDIFRAHRNGEFQA